jgi:hypothetical protein
MTKKRVDSLLKLKNSNCLFEMCHCGHLGGCSPNGKGNMHDDHFQQGHGACNDCECVKFTWKHFCDERGDKI